MPHEQYLRIARDAQARRQAYRLLFRAHLDEETVAEIRQATNGNFVLGDNRYQAEIERALKRQVMRSKAGRPRASETNSAGQDKLF